MPGLIPLMLNPETAGSRSSVLFPTSPFNKSHFRGQSASHMHISVGISPSNSLPDAPRRASMPSPAKEKPAKRLSFACPPSLPLLPYTDDDWRRALADVRRHHVNHRYQACYSRCREILSKIRNNAQVEPAYLISLHFYAATSLEMCIRPCLGSNSHRIILVQQAQEHYDAAATLICQAEETVRSRSRPSSVLSTVSFSLHSSTGSISSRAATPDTGCSSPTPSVCFNDANGQSQAVQQKQSPRKKVSFELPKEEMEEPMTPITPIIRPDSPTLGFEDDYYVAGFMRLTLPEIPTSPRRPETPVTIAVEQDTELMPQALKRQVAMYDAEREHLGDSFLLHSSESRYCAHLMTLKAQIALHKANLTTIVESVPHDPSELLANSPVLSLELRELDKKARIERLRRNGWPRRRFDPSRYEALRMSVLAEMD